MMKELQNRGLLYILILATFALSGCGAANLTADLELNKGFNAPVSPGEGETVVYVIRQPSMLGAARGLYVGLNDKLIKNIGSGRHCYFVIKDGVNTLNL